MKQIYGLKLLVSGTQVVCRTVVLGALSSEQGDKGLQLLVFAEAYLDPASFTRRPHAGRQRARLRLARTELELAGKGAGA